MYMRAKERKYAKNVCACECERVRVNMHKFTHTCVHVYIRIPARAHTVTLSHIRILRVFPFLDIHHLYT